MKHFYHEHLRTFALLIGELRGFLSAHARGIQSSLETNPRRVSAIEIPLPSRRFSQARKPNNLRQSVKG